MAKDELLAIAGNLLFGVGQLISDIVLQVSQDEIPELDKTFKVTLTNVTHGRLGERFVASVTILASDDPYGLFVFSESGRPERVSEGNVTVTLTIQRQKGLMGTVRVIYQTLKETDVAPFHTPGVGRATEGTDFIPVRSSVTFMANQSEANVTLQILDDETPERGESIFVELVDVELIEGAQDRPSKSIVQQVVVFSYPVQFCLYLTLRLLSLLSQFHPALGQELPVLPKL